MELKMKDLQFSSRVVLDAVTKKRKLFDQLSPILSRLADVTGTIESKDASLKAALDERPEVAGYFAFDEAQITRTMALKDEVVFSQDNRIVNVDLHLFPKSLYQDTGSPLTFLQIDVQDPSNQDLHAAASLIRFAAGMPDAIENRGQPLSLDVDRESVEELVKEGFLVAQSDSPVADFSDFEGMLRLQHAGMLFRGAGKGLLIDPHLHSRYSLPDLRSNISARQIVNLVDAIAITHTHGDHYDLTTLMMFPLDIPIIIPKIPRASMICDDVATDLRMLGFTKIVELEWYSAPFMIGALQLFSLPFYGEQPLAHEQIYHPDLRNWGNTYLIKTPQFSTWLLVDSGNDFEGRMYEVGQRVKKEIGPVDVVAGNLATFSPFSPIYITGGYHYWMALTLDQRRRFASMRDHSLTLGVDGVAEVCQAVGAKYYMPYAHWWGELGGHPRSEIGDLKRLEITLKEKHARTIILKWVIGSKIDFSNNTPQINQHLQRSY
jgi:L-ascorbate metabolism protein UlaG (beta-lactamase superfamily)